MTFFPSVAIQTHLDSSYSSANVTPRQTRSPIRKKYDVEHHLDSILGAADVVPLVEPCMDRVDAAILAISKLEKAGGEAAPSPAAPRAAPAPRQPVPSVLPAGPLHSVGQQGPSLTISFRVKKEQPQSTINRRQARQLLMTPTGGRGQARTTWGKLMHRYKKLQHKWHATSSLFHITSPRALAPMNSFPSSREKVVRQRFRMW
jgi:hypothetical protein